MATEIDIPVSVKGEREDAEFSSEFSEGKVTEHPGNRVKQLETRLNQAVETSSRVAETVNTQPESDKRTDEGGIFFQALSVPVATAAEHIKTPDSCETTTTENQEDGSGGSKIETFTEEKPSDEERVAVIATKETDDKSVDTQEASAQSENEARDKSEHKLVEIEQEEQTEVIRPIIEIDEKIEQKNDQKEATESDDGQKKKSDITTVKEVCEEAASEKVESEKEVKLSDISSMKLEEKATHKDDDQEKEQEVNMSEKSQDEDNIKPELVETKEVIEKDTREIEYNATTPTEEERTPKNEEKNEEKVLDSNDNQTKKVESEEVSNLPDDSSMVSNENVIASKEDQDKLYVSEKGQGDGDDVPSSQNASTEFIKETTTSQHATAPAYFEEGQDLNVTPKDILKEEEEVDRTTHPQEESEQCENEAEDKREQKQEESVNEIVHSSLEIKQENDTEDIKPSDEKLGHVITAEASNSAQTEPHVESAEREVHNEEATTESDEGVKLSDNSSMKQNEEPVEILSKNEGQETERELNSSEKDQGEDDATCKETVPEKENECEEGVIHSDSSSKGLNENEIVSKGEYQEKEQEFYMSEKGQDGGDDVTSSQNASSEDIKEMIDQHATKVAYFEEVQGLNATAKDEDAMDRMIVPQEASEQNENEANDKTEQNPEEIMHSGLETEQEEYAKEIKPSVETEVKEEQEGFVGISSQTEIQVESQLEATEHEEEAIKSDDGAKEKSNNPSITEVCEEIDAGKVEYEGVEVSDNSSEKLNEKAIAISSKDEDRETEQDQHEDGAPSSQDATFVEDLQAKSHDGEGQENEAVETREGIEEDNEEIESSVEGKEKVEQEGLLHATTTDVCIITQRKSQEEAIEGNNDDQREKSDDALVEEVCKEVGSEKVEPEEGIKLSDSSNIELNEKAIAISSKDEDQENEQELSMQEETQGEKEVTCSQEASSEKDLEGKNYYGEHIESKLVENGDGIKEDIEVTSANVDTEEIKEQQGSLSGIVSDVCMSAQTEPKEETTKDEEPIQSYDDREEKLAIPCVNEAGEETGLKSIDVQEASEQYENEAKDKREQDLEESANKPVEIGEATIKEDETHADDKEEAYFERSKPEVGDETECKTAGETQNISAENKDDPIADESKSTENPCIAEQDILEEVGEKTTTKPEEITKQASQESQGETNKEIEDKLDAEEYQAGEQEDGSEMKDETVLIENVSTELGQPMEQNVEEDQACLTTTMNEKMEDVIAKKDEDLSLGSIQVSNDNTVKEEKSFLDGKTREIEISTLEHEPIEEKTTTKSEEITKQDFQESQSETNKEEEAKLDAENQAEGGEDESEKTDEVVLTEKMSSELGQPMEQNVEDIEACGTTTTSEKIEDDIAKKIEDLSLGNIEDRNDNDSKEEESFLDERTRETEISTLEHAPVGDKTTMELEDVTKQVIQESQIETNKEIEAKLDAEYQVDGTEHKSETKDDVVMTKEMSSELGQLVEQNAEEIQACRTTIMSEEIEDEIVEKNEDLSHGSVEDKNDNTVKEEKSFLDGKTREIETATLEHEPVEEKTTTNSEEITKQAFQESESETNKEIDTKLDAENQADEREDRELKEEIVLVEKMSSELGQPMEQNVEEIQACGTTSTSEKIEDDIAEKIEDLSLGSIEDKDGNTVKEEKSFLDEKTREIETSTLEHEPVGEKTTTKSEEIAKHAFQESEIETNMEIDTKLDAKSQVEEREDKRETKDEVALTEKLEQPMEENIEEINSCQSTTVSGKIEDEITEKNEDFSLGNIEDKDDNIVKEEKSFIDEKTREIEISTSEHEVGEKTTMEPEDITKQAFQESKTETTKEIEAELDAEYQARGREDGREIKDEVVLTEKISSELEQPVEQNVEEIQAYQTTTMNEKVEDEITKKDEDLSLGNVEVQGENTIKEEESFLDERTREIEISAFEHEPVGEKTTIKPEEIIEHASQESQSETKKEIEALTKKMSLELEQPMEQNVEEIQACQTTTMSEKIEDAIAEKNEDLSIGNREDKDDNIVEEEKSFLDGNAREIEISALENEPVVKLEEITEQAFQESHVETNKEIEAKLDAENQAGEREERREMKDEVVLTEKISLELEQPVEQNVEEILACQTTTITEKTEDEIVKNEDLSHDSIKDANENIANEEKSVLDGKTREIELSTSEHEPVEEKNGGLDEVPKKKDTDLNEATTVELQEDFIPSISPGTSTEDTPNSENSKAESENLPIEDLDSVSEVQIPRVVPNSEDSNINEECRISATTTAVDEERGTVTKETSSDEISYSDPTPVENPEVIKVIKDDQTAQEVADSEESKVKEELIDLETAEYADENNGEEEQETKTNEISSVEKKEQTTESKQVIEPHSVLCPDAVLTEENLELQGELIPTSELMIDEYRVDETKPQPEQSDITSEQQVVVETEKEEGSTEVKQQDFEEDNCPKELEKTSTSNQKELANEIEVSKSIPIGNTEVAEIESIHTPSNDQDDMKLRESMLIEQKGVLSSQLTDREILEEEATENKKEAPNHEFEKDEKDDGLISEIQAPEENIKMEIKEEHLEATNNSYETVTGGLSSEKFSDEVKEIDAKEDTEKIVRQEEKVAEDSNQDAVAEVTAHDHLLQTEEKLGSMVPPEELTSPKAEDQTNELVSETDKTKVDHSSISSKDWNPELMEEKFTNTLPEDQISVKEQCIEEEGQDNVGAESKEAKSGNGVVEDVVVNEVLLEVEKAKEESDNINKEGSFIPNQLTSATDEVCQIKSLDSSPSELLEQDKEVKSEEISGHGDTHKLEEEPTEVFELTPEVDEMVGEGKEVSRTLTENLPEGSPEMLLVKQDPETTTTIEKSEEEIKDKDETLVNMDFSTSSEEVACLSNEKAGELQVSTMNAEGKQDGLIDMLNKETEAVQPQEHISDTKSVDPPSDVEIREQGELLTEPSEDNTLPSQNDEKTADLLVIPSVSKETIQCVDKPIEEAPAIDDQKHENDLDYTANARVVDVVSKAESPEIEQQHLDTKEAKVEAINQENIESEIPIEKVPKPTAAHEETANELLVMPVATEEEKPNYLQDYSKEEEHSGKRTYQDLEAVTEPSQTDKLSDEVKKAESIDTQEGTKAEENLHEEKTGKRTKITEATVDLHHEEKGDETNCKATSTEAAIPIEHVKSSDMVKGESVPKCASTRNPEVRSAILEVLSVMDATDDKPGYNKDPSDKTAEAHVAEKEVLNEDVHLESTSDISKTTEKISGTNQEPFNLPLTKERSMQLDAPVTPGTVKDDLTKTSQIQPELQKDEVSARAVDKQLPEKTYQDESTESKLVTANIDASHEQEGEPTAKSLNASGTEPQCSSEVVKEEKKTSDEKEKPETPERAPIVFTDILHEPTQANSKVAENLIKERELDITKDEQVDKEETGDKGAKTDEEDEAEEDDEDNQKTGGAPVMIEASKDMEVKTPKKSHNILSGVGSKVKHSIAKVKKAITGKSSSPKPPSPKARD